VFGAPIPVITFDVVLSDDDAVLPVTQNIDGFFTLFLDQVLNEHSGTYKYDYSHFDSKVIVSVFQHGNSRLLNTGYSVKVDGTAYYFDDEPTSESLLHSMKLYFNFWGKE